MISPLHPCRPGNCAHLAGSAQPASAACPCYPARETALRPTAGLLEGVAHGSVVRQRTGGRCMTVLGFPPGGQLLLCGWLEDGQVRSQVFPRADLEFVSAFGETERLWLDSFRAHGTIVHLLRTREPEPQKG